MPYSMKFYYNGTDKTSDYIDVKVYWFSLVDSFGSHALCWTVSEPAGDAPEGLKKGIWLTANNKFLVPNS